MADSDDIVYVEASKSPYTLQEYQCTLMSNHKAVRLHNSVAVQVSIFEGKS